MHTATHPAAKLARKVEAHQEDAEAHQAELLAQFDVEAEDDGREG